MGVNKVEEDPKVSRAVDIKRQVDKAKTMLVKRYGQDVADAAMVVESNSLLEIALEVLADTVSSDVAQLADDNSFSGFSGGDSGGGGASGDY